VTRRHAENPEEAEINITPMMDIVFIMLIFFIVTTSFVRETGIDPNRPEAVTAIEQERGNIHIGVSADDQIWMEQRPIELAAVRRMVEQARSEIPESTVIILADEGASTGVVIDLMDQIRLGGILNISVAAQPSAGEG
jgi:biopolymer transport protein ExbD